MRLRRPAAAVLGLLAVMPALAACGGDDGVTVGDIIGARQDDQFIQDGQKSSIALPIGRLEVSMGEASTELDANDTRQLEPVTAPENSAFVPITWQYDAGTFGDYADYLDTDTRPVIDLVADGAKYRLPSPESTGEGAESFYVLVTGDLADAKEATLSVEFDDVIQTVDLATGDREAGLAAPLYELKPRKERTASCTNQAEFDLPKLARLGDFSCNITRSADIPYAGGAWAPEGTAWRVVTISTVARRYDVIAADLRSGAIYVASAVESTFRLGKEKPTKVIEDREFSACPDPERGGCTSVYHLIFEADEDTSERLRVDQGYELTLSSLWGGGEGKRTVEIEGTISVKLR
ncbi:hypothetical protein [Nocardioides sp. Root190]|uniref:hypothetical protein n=1 Tax=Nocardioides sp. Root190 TaxID=1736488 RepID=UPI0012F95431|nr:hypothetical protein [Nocardioides sp. Root190]